MSEHVSLLQDLRKGKDCNLEAIAAIEDLETRLAAAEAAGEKQLRLLAGAGVERLNEVAPGQGWDSGSTVAEMYIRDFRAAIDAASGEDPVRRDAERYRKLRAMRWDCSPLCVIRFPKLTVKLGSDCPYGERLDELVDAARGADNGGPGS